MGSRRVKFTIPGMMIAVAVVAVLLAVAVRMHPQPVQLGILISEGNRFERDLGSFEGYEVTCSDGSKTTVGPDGPIPRCNGGEPFAFGFFRRVEWYDGTWKRRTG